MKQQTQHLLLALAFSTTSLGAVHMLNFVWLTAFVYHGNIRGYVPAGLTGLFRLGIAWLLLQIPLALVGRRRRQTASYLLGGFLGVPTAVILCSLYASILLAIFGYSLQKDIAISSVGVILFIAVSAILYKCYMSKKADNNWAASTRALVDSNDSP